MWLTHIYFWKHVKPLAKEDFKKKNQRILKINSDFSSAKQEAHVTEGAAFAKWELFRMVKNMSSLELAKQITRT